MQEDFGSPVVSPNIGVPQALVVAKKEPSSDKTNENNLDLNANDENGHDATNGEMPVDTAPESPQGARVKRKSRPDTTNGELPVDTAPESPHGARVKRKPRNVTTNGEMPVDKEPESPHGARVKRKPRPPGSIKNNAGQRQSTVKVKEKVSTKRQAPSAVIELDEQMQVKIDDDGEEGRTNGEATPSAT